MAPITREGTNPLVASRCRGPSGLRRHRTQRSRCDPGAVPQLWAVSGPSRSGVV